MQCNHTNKQTNKQTQKSPGQYFSMDKSTAAFAKASQMGSYTASCRPVLQCHSAIDFSKKRGSKGSALGYRPKQPSQNRSGSDLMPNDPRSILTLIQSSLTDTLSTSRLNNVAAECVLRYRSIKVRRVVRSD